MRGLIVAALLVLCACESVIDPQTDADILDEYKAFHQRLDRLSFPIMQTNVDLCPRQIFDNGLRWHRLSDYPKGLEDTAKTHFKLGEGDHVFFMRPDSLAAQKGVKPGDTRDAIPALGAGERVCNYRAQIRFEPDANAYANGDSVIVTSGLMRSLSDDALALVIAHELAHNVLGHARDAISADNEREADRYAVYFMARAGLDFEAAIRSRAATDQPHLGRTKPLKNSETRREHFERTAKKVKQLVAEGKPLNPLPKA